MLPESVRVWRWSHQLPVDSWCLWALIVCLLALVGPLIFCVYKLWKKLERMEAQLQTVVDDAKVDGMMIGAFGHESKEGLEKLEKYIKKVHRGLIKAS